LAIRKSSSLTAVTARTALTVPPASVPAAAAPQPSIAILPLENLGPSAQQYHLGQAASWERFVRRFRPVELSVCPRAQEVLGEQRHLVRTQASGPNEEPHRNAGSRDARFAPAHASVRVNTNEDDKDQEPVSFFLSRDLSKPRRARCGAPRPPYCLLPTAYCLLPTAYCLLPAASCQLLRSRE
jgi:hypothetical protein